MATFRRANFKVAEFLRWWERDQLILQPKFQRRQAWEYAARSWLIDTVVRGLPMPKVYLRRVVHPKTRLGAYEVVDGQQRLKAIVDFRGGELTLSRRHNPDLGDTTFEKLPDAAQRTFLEYEISTEVMEDATDPEVWAMFERLNSYTLTLNKQEKLNAKWFGYFKQAAYRLAAEESALDAWRQLRVFGNRAIARMREVELTSDVLVAIVRGTSDITDIPAAYEDFDEEFGDEEAASRTFRAALSFITEELSDAVRTSRFRRRAWFYSLMVAIADAKAGIPGGLGPARLRNGEEVGARMRRLDEALKPVEPPSGLASLRSALSRATSHVPERRVRHEQFFWMLTLPERSWRERWSQLTAREQER
jgi:hypothetical protein